ASVQRIALITDENGYNRRRAAQHDQAHLGQAVAQLADVPPKLAGDYFIFVRHEDVADGADGIEVWWHHRAAEDVGVRAHLEQTLELGGASDEAAGTREAFRQRADHQGVGVIAQRLEDG